jgi:hypothetical protein
VCTFCNVAITEKFVLTKDGKPAHKECKPKKSKKNKDDAKDPAGEAEA